MGYLDVAAGEVGYFGPAENVNKYWADLQPSWQGSAWCFCFVSWCLKQAGQLSAIGGSPMYYCPAGVAKAQQLGQWFAQPEVGALVFYTWGTGVPAHIEFVESFTSSTITVIGGNTSGVTSDCVARKTRQRSAALGYWHLNAVPGGGGGGGTNTGGESLSYGQPQYTGTFLPAPVPTITGEGESPDVRFAGSAFLAGV